MISKEQLKEDLDFAVVLLTAMKLLHDKWGTVMCKQKRFKHASKNNFNDVWNTDRVRKTVSRSGTSNGESPVTRVVYSLIVL